MNRPVIRFETEQRSYIAITTLPYGVKKALYNMFTDALIRELETHNYEFVGKFMDGKIKVRFIEDEH